MTTTERKAMFERLRAQHTTPATTRTAPRATTEAPATDTATASTFETAKRNLETAFKNGNAYGDDLQKVAVILARSVIRRLIDPTKTAARNAVINGTAKADENGNLLASNSGCNPVMLALYNALYSDNVIVNGTEYANRYAYRAAFSPDGDARRETINTDARDIDNELSDRAFSDAYDIVQEIAVTILEYLKNGNTDEINLDAPFTHEVIAKRVYRQHEKVITKEEETTIIRESVRAGRRLIDDARAVSIDAAAAMCYDEEETEIDGETVQIYRRLNKSQVEMFVYETDFGYGADADTVDTVETMLEKIGVRHSEKRILSMLMRGVSVADIADAMGISETAVRKHRTNLQKRAIECGYIPQGYRDTETVTADNAPRAVKQISDGVCVVYDSVKQAAKITGINGGSIRAAAAGKRETAGGYVWEFITTKA